MSNFLLLTNDVLDVGAITSLVTDESTGAISIFVGKTRNHFGGKKVLLLSYEAYESMALKKMSELCDMLREKWSLHNIAIYHRLGEARPKEASVVIAVTSEHRQASLEAVAFGIDTLKATVPIWKKEVYESGEVWKENRECEWSVNKKLEKSLEDFDDEDEIGSLEKQ
jgi:molybdopterin synthase catalytic subunit